MDVKIMRPRGIKRRWSTDSETEDVIYKPPFKKRRVRQQPDLSTMFKTINISPNKQSNVPLKTLPKIRPNIPPNRITNSPKPTGKAKLLVTRHPFYNKQPKPEMKEIEENTTDKSIIISYPRKRYGTVLDNQPPTKRRRIGSRTSNSKTLDEKGISDINIKIKTKHLKDDSSKCQLKECQKYITELKTEIDELQAMNKALLGQIHDIYFEQDMIYTPISRGKQSYIS